MNFQQSQHQLPVLTFTPQAVRLGSFHFISSHLWNESLQEFNKFMGHNRCLMNMCPFLIFINPSHEAYMWQMRKESLGINSIVRHLLEYTSLDQVSGESCKISVALMGMSWMWEHWESSLSFSLHLSSSQANLSWGLQETPNDRTEGLSGTHILISSP